MVEIKMLNLSILGLILGSVFFIIGYASDTKTYKSITDVWLEHSHPHVLDKWLTYGEHYDTHLPKPGAIDPATGKPKQIKLLEIGIQSGGSIVDWREYYGDNSLIVGVDIDKRCKRSENKEKNIFVEIGSQLNATFLIEVCKKYGPFDVIIDDGGHTEDMIITSLYALYPENQCLSINGGVYAVEDLHTQVMKFYMKSHHAFMHRVVTQAYLAMHDYWDKSKTYTYDANFAKKIVAIHLYDSLAFFVKKVPKPLVNIHRGKDQFANIEYSLNPPGTYHDN